jgi:hypothetical protein
MLPIFIKGIQKDQTTFMGFFFLTLRQKQMCFPGTHMCYWIRRLLLKGTKTFPSLIGLQVGRRVIWILESVTVCTGSLIVHMCKRSTVCMQGFHSTSEESSIRRELAMPRLITAITSARPPMIGPCHVFPCLLLNNNWLKYLLLWSPCYQ